ncbi:MAG: iron ABC transporter permease [Acidimicrobiales bacterium]|nr:iron ABC transporter permease [Acidimicrobiales bacterium]
MDGYVATDRVLTATASGPPNSRRVGDDQNLVSRVWIAAIGGVFSLPPLFVLFRAALLGGESLDEVTGALGPLWRTIQLGALVAITTAVLGSVMAWLVVRTDLPGRRIWHTLLSLPIVLPSFIGAAAYAAALAPNGVLYGPLDLVGLAPQGRLAGMGAAWFVLTVFTFPYVFLPVAARLSVLPASLEESARMLGRNGPQAFREAVLPQLRPAIRSGALIVFLYTISDYGAVQLLRFDTLTRKIFSARLADRAAFYVLATMLVILTFVAVAAQRRRVPGTMETPENPGVAQPPIKLSGWRRIAALAVVAATLTAALLAPVASLVVWAWRGVADGRVDYAELIGPLVNTATIGLITAAVVVTVLVPLALSTVRRSDGLAGAASIAVTAGYAAPGVVIALALSFWVRSVPGFFWLYLSFPLLLAGYAIQFGALALGSAEDAVRAVPRSVRESARLLEPDRNRRIALIHFPLMRPGLVSGGGLVLLSVVKELPITLLLAPLGFNTMATRIWAKFEEGYAADAGVFALVLLLVSGVLTWLLVLRAMDS